MKLLRVLGLTSIVLLPNSAVADFLGVRLVAGQWQAQTDGSLGRDSADLAGELQLDDGDNDFYSLSFEHPVPLIPNVRLTQMSMETSGNSLLGSDVVLDEVQFQIGEQVQTQLDLSHTDLTLYYELLDNYVSADIGVTARRFDGQASMTSELQNESVELDAVVPLAYGRARFDLPLTGLAAAVEGNWMNVDELRLVDWGAQIQYDWEILPAVDAGIILGYRNMTLELDDLDDLHADTTFDGVYLAFELHL